MVFSPKKEVMKRGERELVTQSVKSRAGECGSDMLIKLHKQQEAVLFCCLRFGGGGLI